MRTQVLIIGAGVTGTGLARDLAMRGVACMVVEKQDVNAGASGGNHGLLHSGARYVASDPAAAGECRTENQILKRTAAHCIEDTGGFFVAVAGDNEGYIADFPEHCRRCGIPTQPVDLNIAREMEPALSDQIIAVFAVDDAAVDPFKLAFDNMADARRLGAGFKRFCRVTGFDVTKGRIQRVRVRDVTTGQTKSITAEVIVNATGAWAGEVAGLAGIPMGMRYAKGSLLVAQQRLTQRVINRLRPPTDGDILVPGGTVSILGTTSERVRDPDVIYPEIHEVDAIIDAGAAIIPALAHTRFIRAYCGVRPLPKADPSTVGNGNDRAVSRGFVLIDHARQTPKISNLVTITGGKLTTYRLMAEKAADWVCRRLGVTAACQTRCVPLPDSVEARWTEPGLAPHLWLRNSRPDDMLLCECEMVPQSVVEQIVAGIEQLDGRPTLEAVGLRSRIGKGPCQGTFCSQRVAAYLYDQAHL
ncbi:MAG: anaerobic glycerol-3-phosphate dehydrogenase subunit A, partial [Desulfatitalea sp.]|nr:anaerobic glycerol-3-phosphate dehydrogenase subunit A [Desulfatitalea sp.]NNJ99203.1 anaerobic glycerol-3-phosphate dehydrogenase subunit A [Desulfatitalea sp.]